MKVLRPAPDGWTKVCWPDEAIALLATRKVEMISLDHDLGDDNRGTCYVALWIEEAVALHGFKPPTIMVHSANPAASLRMQDSVAAILRIAKR